MDNTVKTETYDKFSCIADLCPFSCCKGWDIIIDTDTYDKWKSDQVQSGYLCRFVKTTKTGRRTKNNLKLDSHKNCCFLNEKGLCDVIIKCGEAYLPKTCRLFPRILNHDKNVDEYSLSCACPAVVDLINNQKGNMNFLYSGEEDIFLRLPIEYRIRTAMIFIMQDSCLSLKNRILLIFFMLLAAKKEQGITEEIIERYQDDKYLQSLTDIWNGTDIAKEDTLQETNELFSDIVLNYKIEKNYGRYLKDISDLAETIDFDHAAAQWDESKAEFNQYGQLLENCLVSKIFANCISSNIYDMIMSFQLVVTEYVMTKYSAFLMWKKNKDTQNSIQIVKKKDRYVSPLPCEDKQEQVSFFKSRENITGIGQALNYYNIRDYIVVYSRIIGYNAEGIREFWNDSFEEAIWDFGYLFLLLN